MARTRAEFVHHAGGGAVPFSEARNSVSPSTSSGLPETQDFAEEPRTTDAPTSSASPTKAAIGAPARRNRVAHAVRQLAFMPSRSPDASHGRQPQRRPGRPRRPPPPRARRATGEPASASLRRRSPPTAPMSSTAARSRRASVATSITPDSASPGAARSVSSLRKLRNSAMRSARSSATFPFPAPPGWPARRR